MSKLRSLFLLPLVALALAAAGCGEEDVEQSAADKAAEQAEKQAKSQPAATAEEIAPPKATKIEPTAGERDLDEKPKIPRAKGDPPTELKVEDLVVGDGPAAKTGDQLSVQYVGVLYKNGEQFDASWDNDKKEFPFTLGQGAVIPGWDQGLVGMKVGGRRKLTIPPDLAYGAQGSPPKIGPNETLIFEVDLKKIGS